MALSGNLSLAKAPAEFATTAWSIVLRSTRPDSPEARPALEFLCRAYWTPLYEFARRMGQSEVEAEDGVQGFFAHLIQSNVLQYADPTRGRFRSFLLASFRQHLAKVRERAGAAKRQPGGAQLSLDAAEEEHFARHAEPDRVFEYLWAVTVLDRARERLREECVADGRADRFDAFQGALTGTDPPDAAAKLGLSPGTLRVALHRFRQRYAELVRAEIRATVESDAEVESELTDLLAAVRQARSFKTGEGLA